MRSLVCWVLLPVSIYGVPVVIHLPVWLVILMIWCTVRVQLCVVQVLCMCANRVIVLAQVRDLVLGRVLVR